MVSNNIKKCYVIKRDNQMVGELIVEIESLGNK